MQSKPLIPRKIINVKGKIHYNENRQAWSNLFLKNEIINEFPQLKEKRSKFGYEMLFFKNSEELNNALKKLKNEEVMPMLVWLYKEN